MDSNVEISDNEDDLKNDIQENQDTIILSSDKSLVSDISSDEEQLQLPKVTLQNRIDAAVKNLFPILKNKPEFVCPENEKNVPSTSVSVCNMSKLAGVEKMISGVRVHIPVEPYGCQIALMSKVITAIKNGQNCLLESPTGSGKTLALLCGALAWQQHERNRLNEQQTQQLAPYYDELKVEGAVDYVTSTATDIVKVTPEKLFSRTAFGEKNIYDKPETGNFGFKRNQPFQDSPKGSPSKDGLVAIHKKQRLKSVDSDDSPTVPEVPCTPPKGIEPQQPSAPQKRNIRTVLDNLRMRTSLLVDCSVPTIYYGARTHKQLQQVIKEFSRTTYCGQTKMTVLSSREYSCIRDFDRSQWNSKNDMCRSCIKPDLTTEKRNQESNCKYYDNRMALNHKCLPPAFDLEDLISKGKEMAACPYYAARLMSGTAHIVFCPYNYLIDPSIRNSLGIDLQDQIVIVDEAHNIEDICRDTATYTFTRDNIQAAVKELETVSQYRYTNQDVLNYIDQLLKTLKSWEDWFANQLPLLNNKPINNREAVHLWQIQHFVQTLNNHNIGQGHFSDFAKSCDIFCKRLREDPRTLYGVTQATGSLFESLQTVLGYLFNDSGKYMEDFKPALVRTVIGGTDQPPEATSWRTSQFNKWVEKETLSLRLMCMNPAVVFSGLKSARCIILASGTLTPLVSLHSELDTDFPIKISPNHVIPKERVWIGTLSTCPDGSRLECTSRYTEQPDIQDALGQAVLSVSRVTPHGVLCFLPSYQLMNRLVRRWEETGLWQKLTQLKYVFQESRNVKDHNDNMEDYYKYVKTIKGAILFAVYRGKVSEGMDFKDEQARAVITIGVPYPSTFDMGVSEKKKYNDIKSKSKNLLSGSEWLRVQAYRALNQAVGRCVRHRGDWGAVLLVDARFTNAYYTEHLSKWVRNFLENKHLSYDQLVNGTSSLETFMESMRLTEAENDGDVNGTS